MENKLSFIEQAREAENYLLSILPKGKIIYAVFLGNRVSEKGISQRYKFFTIVDGDLVCLDHHLFEAQQVASIYKEKTKTNPSHIVLTNQNWKVIIQRIGECLYGNAYVFPQEEKQLLDR